MGFQGHWTATRSKSGAKIWLDGRPMFAVIAGLSDSRVPAGKTESLWEECLTELLKRMNVNEPL